MSLEGDGVSVSDEDRREAKAILEGKKNARRESARLAQLADRGLGRKLSAKASAVMVDESLMDELVLEKGGDERFLRWLCVQVAEGVTLRDISRDYCVQYGLLWDFLSSDSGRLERYYRAQRGLADAEVAETLGLADSADVEDVSVKKLQIETRFRRGGKYDRQRFGESVQVDVKQTVDVRVALQEARSRVEGRRVIDVEQVEQVMPEKLDGGSA